LLARRQLITGLGAVALGLRTRPASSKPAPRDFTYAEQVLEVPGEKLARRCLLLVPTDKRPLPGLVVLLHGLGETTSEEVGIRAWADRYGLLEAARRLVLFSPLRSDTKPVLVTDERCAAIEGELAARPFRGFAVACPFTPNVFRQPSGQEALDRYAGWLTDGVLPEIRRRIALPAGGVCIDGVSLGGFISLEVFLRRPEAFRAVGGLQAAVGENLAEVYARRFRSALDQVGPRRVRIATSTWDNERKASERLRARLVAHDVPVTYSVSRGGHDQRFLREVGTLELMLYYDRVLSYGSAAP
jgi:predicted esterase